MVTFKLPWAYQDPIFKKSNSMTKIEKVWGVVTVWVKTALEEKQPSPPWKKSLGY